LVDRLLQEARENTLDLVGEDPAITGRMLIYLYNPGYYASIKDQDDSDSDGVPKFLEPKRRSGGHYAR
jgi:hypothetical protein